ALHRLNVLGWFSALRGFTLRVRGSSLSDTGGVDEPDFWRDAADRDRRARYRQGDEALGRGLRRRTVVLRRPAAADRLPLQRPVIGQRGSVDRARQLRRGAARIDPTALRHAEPLLGLSQCRARGCAALVELAGQLPRDPRKGAGERLAYRPGR